MILRIEIVATSVVDFFYDRYRECIVSIFDLAKHVPQFHADESDCEIYRKSGRLVNVSLKSSTLKIDGRRYLFITFFDLTLQKREQKKQEDQLKELAQIAKLADIGMLAAGVAHELNNPLMIIQGYAENIDILLDRPELIREGLKSQTSEILRATDRMTRIISQMSRMVRSTDVNFEVIDLGELVDNIARFLAHQLKSHKVKLVIDIKESIIIKCDSNQVEQVMLNILNNAIHATCENKEDRQVRITCELKEGRTLLSFWNNGPSIPQEIQTKIMTPFYTTKEVGKGTGLGLTVSFGIMKAHGGRLTFRSSPEYGTEFTLDFKTEKIDKPKKNQTAGKCVLIVDDDIQALEVLVQKVTHFGFQAIRSSTAAEALQILSQKQNVIAVFTDVRMPDMDGVSLANKIRQIMNPGPPIYAFTGYNSSPKLQEDLANAGVCRVLTKPLNHHVFTEIMFELSNPGKKKSA